MTRSYPGPYKYVTVILVVADSEEAMLAGARSMASDKSLCAPTSGMDSNGVWAMHSTRRYYHMTPAHVSLLDALIVTMLDQLEHIALFAINSLPLFGMEKKGT